MDGIRLANTTLSHHRTGPDQTRVSTSISIDMPRGRTERRVDGTEQWLILPPGHVSPPSSPHLTSPHDSSRTRRTHASISHVVKCRCYGSRAWARCLSHAHPYPCRRRRWTWRWRRLTSPPLPRSSMEPAKQVLCVVQKYNATDLDQHGPDQHRPEQKTTAGASAANGRERASEQDEASIPPLPSPTDPALCLTQARKPASPTRSSRA
jgi:hypothetical protein